MIPIGIFLARGRVFQQLLYKCVLFAGIRFKANPLSSTLSYVFIVALFQHDGSPLLAGGRAILFNGSGEHL